MSMKNRLVCLAAFAGLAATAAAQELVPYENEADAGPHSPTYVDYELPPVLYVDDMAELELANKLGLSRPRNPGARGLETCPSIISDNNNCHVAMTSLGAAFSGMAPGSYRVMDNIMPQASNPTRMCWIGRYTDRAGPAVADERFRIAIYGSLPSGLPDLSSGPLFVREFMISGTAGVDMLEMSCLDGETCPGTSSPASGGHYVYSAEVATGFPMMAGVLLG